MSVSGVDAGGALVLFTRDLRVRDQPALTAALRDRGRVVAAFVLDRDLLAGSCGSPNRLAFLIDCLEDLTAALAARGAHLAVRRGDVVEEAMRLVAEHDLDAIHMSADVTPYARRRHDRLSRACARERVALHTHPGVTVVAPGALTPAGGEHYRVFTPYWRAWRSVPCAPLLPAPARIGEPVPVNTGSIPSAATLAGVAPSAGLQVGGEGAARARLARWQRGGPERYQERHDSLAEDATSRLSADLHFGCVSARTVLARAEGSEHAEAFVRQLCWRDFHHQVLAARPDLPRADYRPRGDRWRRDRAATQAWREGRTGYPIVDAGMRQLASEGFMHNRARLIVASFLTKTLYIDWRTGAAHFASLLQDADVASNVGNWQWVAGTGNDTRPNRVLNPIRQARRFDPGGDYVRRYVPELAGVDGGAVHEPWRLDPARPALRYPAPLVDHESAARAFRARRGG